VLREPGVKIGDAVNNAPADLRKARALAAQLVQGGARQARVIGGLLHRKLPPLSRQSRVPIFPSACHSPFSAILGNEGVCFVLSIASSIYEGVQRIR